MIIDNKIDSLPIVAKIMSVIPLGFASMFICFGLWMIGVPFLLLTLAGVTAQQRVKIDFNNKLIKNYYRILLIDFGKWKTLKDFQLISLTPDTTVYRERNYTWNPSNAGARLYEFRTGTIVLNLKINNREKYVIAKGSFNTMFKLAKNISLSTRKDIFDCTLKNPTLIKYQKNMNHSTSTQSL